MSKYVLTQEQLDSLQDQIQQLIRQNDAKQERIRELELHKICVLNSETADVLQTIERLENETDELKKANEQLMTDLDSNKVNVRKLEMLLEEERKYRNYSEMLAKEMELKCAEESLIRELTSELCQLQKVEIDIDNKRIEELQYKLNKFIDEAGNHQIHDPKEIKEAVNIRSRENSLRNNQIKLITEKLKTQLFDLQRNIENSPVKTKEDHDHLKEIGKWLQETRLIMADVNVIETLRNELNYMRQEIENKRKLVLKS